MGLMGHQVDNNLTITGTGILVGILARRAHFRIAADINMTAHYWPVVSGPFVEMLTSDSGHTINYFRQLTNRDGGLFGETGAGVVFRGLTFDNASIIATRGNMVNAGILTSGHSVGSITVEDVSVYNSEIRRRIASVPESRISNIGG